MNESELQPSVPNAGPHTDLGKLLLAMVQSIGAREPRAFVDVDITKALEQADALTPPPLPH